MSRGGVKHGLTVSITVQISIGHASKLIPLFVNDEPQKDNDIYSHVTKLDSVNQFVHCNRNSTLFFLTSEGQ